MQTVHESLDRRHIELLVALKQTGHLSNAASMLHLSASAASHRLREAERRLGIQLTVAAGRSIEMTQAALHLAEIGEASQRAMRSAEETARWMASANRPAVRIALDFYDTAPWFERLVGQPGLPCALDFVRVGYDDVDAAVARGRADLGVVVQPAGAATNKRRDMMLCSDELVGCIRNDHPAAQRGALWPSDIETTTYTTAGDRPAHGFEHHEFFEPSGVRPRHLRKVESLAMALRLIRSFGGFTVQPALALREAPLDGLTIVPLHETNIAMQWLVVLRHAQATDDEREIASAIHTLVNK